MDSINNILEKFQYERQHKNGELAGRGYQSKEVFVLAVFCFFQFYFGTMKACLIQMGMT